MLLSCIRAEQIHMSKLHPATSTAKSISLTAETHLELEVKYKGKTHFLNGKADYSVWYDDREMGTNLVICELKDIGGVATGIPQCLAYMGKLFFIFFWPRMHGA
jgi:hypothetical protein